MKVKGNKEMLTIEQVANALQLHRMTIFRYLKNGKIRGIKIGRDWRISEEELERIKRYGC